FRAKPPQHDAALQEAVVTVYDTEDEHLRPPLPPPIVGEVKDNTRLFPAARVQAANEELRKIQGQVKKDLAIEVFKTPPPGKVKQVKYLSPEGRKEFFNNWLEERLRLARGDEVLVLICQKPLAVRVGTTEALKQKV